VGAQKTVELSPPGSNRPYFVIDDGWQQRRNTAGPWDRGNEAFPDLPRLAGKIRQAGVRPGIWMRPLYFATELPPGWLSARASEKFSTIDPTVPEGLEQVHRDVARLREWGFEMLKHDFSSFDLFGRWGFAMGAEFTSPGWHFHNRMKTNAEVVLDLYRAIREAAGGMAIIGCNTFSHLCAGLVEVNRTGDDTSGRDFNRTRRMGVNTLAFRGAQHGAFYAVDADCAPITRDVPWREAEQWLRLLARSGTAVLVSANYMQLDQGQLDAVRQVFAIASKPRPVAEPIDWFDTRTPSRWRLAEGDEMFQWCGLEGASPFPER
jgi:alpha-galactosidase